MTDAGRCLACAVNEQPAYLAGRVAKRAVPRREQDILGVHGQRACEMDRVVSAEGMSFSEFAGVVSEPFIDADDPQLPIEGIQLLDGQASDLTVDPARRVRPERCRRSAIGSRTSPRARRSANGSRLSTGTRRATRRPRIVTTISAPACTCWTYRLRWSWSSRTPTSIFGWPVCSVILGKSTRYINGLGISPRR